MANDEQVQLLKLIGRKKESAEAWTKLCAKHSYIDLSRADLSHLNLSELWLSGVDLSGAKLYNTNLSKANLSKSTMPYVDLRRSNLAGARLDECNLMAANLSGANLVESSMERANLQGAVMAGAHLVGAVMKGARLDRADLRGANLKKAQCSNAAFEQVNVEDANLTGASLSEDQLNQMLHLEKAVRSVRRGASGTGGGGRRQLVIDDDYADLFEESDAYKILEVDPGASFDEITKAYRQRAKEYHPDRVAHLGRKLKEVARREFDRIQHAYKSVTHYQTKPDMDVAINVGKSEVMNVSQDFTLDHYVALSERYPSDDRILYNLGNKYMEHNMVQQAALAFERATKANPANEYAQHNLKIANLMCQLSRK